MRPGRAARLIGGSIVLLVAGVAAHGAATVGEQPQTAPSSSWSSRIDPIFAEWNRPDSPGCAVALFRDGAIVFERGYGMADLEHGAPITPDSVFYVGSVSKQFTAMAATLAAAEGRLSPDDDIRRYLPEMPDYGARVTIRHLLHHTAGLRDYNTLLDLAGRRDDEAFDNRTVLGIAARQKALNFEPGTEYLYSNTNYTLLAVIVERATATRFAAYAEQRMFRPLGMASTHFHDDLTRLVKHRAFGYRRDRDGTIRLDTPGSQRTGAGGLFTTVRDLLAWDRNFYDAKVGGRAALDELQTPGTLANGKVLDYARGLALGRYRGLRIVEHGGSLAGYRAHLVRFPDERFSVACLCNLAGINAGALSRRIADAALGDRFTESTPAGPSSSGSTPPAPPRPEASSGAADDPPARLADYRGEYYSDELETTFTVGERNGSLALRRETDSDFSVLEPAGPGAFRLRNLTLRFLTSAAGTVERLTVDAGRVRGIKFVKKEEGGRR